MAQISKCCILFPCVCLKEHMVDDLLNDADAEDDVTVTEQSLSSNEISQYSSQPESTQSSDTIETSLSSEEPIQSPTGMCTTTVLTTPSKVLSKSSKENYQSSDHSKQSLSINEAKSNTGRVTKFNKTIQEENALMKKAINCLDSLQCTSRNASFTEKDKDGLDKFGDYIVSELRNIANPQALSWAKLQMQNIILSAQTVPVQSKPPFFVPTSPPFPPDKMY